MQIIIFPAIGWLLLLINNLITTFMPINFFGYELYFTPHLVLIYLLVLTVYKNPKIALVLAILFGILCDIYIGNIYGLYTFGFIIAVLLMDQLFKVFYKDLKMMVALLLLFVLLFESFKFVTVKVLGLATAGYFGFVFAHLIPTLLINFLFIIIVFPILLKILDKYTI